MQVPQTQVVAEVAAVTHKLLHRPVLVDQEL
jgi:hypothetical protein